MSNNYSCVNSFENQLLSNQQDFLVTNQQIHDMLDCHQPHALFYQSPSFDKSQLQPLHIQPYDENEIRQKQAQLASIQLQSIFDVQRLVTAEKAKLSKNPVVISSQHPQIPIQCTTYQTSTLQLYEQLQNDSVLPRLQHNINDVGSAVINGQEGKNIGFQPFENEDIILNQLNSEFEKIRAEENEKQRKVQEEKEQQQQQEFLQQQQQQNLFAKQSVLQQVNGQTVSAQNQQNSAKLIQQSDQLVNNALNALTQSKQLQAQQSQIAQAFQQQNNIDSQLQKQNSQNSLIKRQSSTIDTHLSTPQQQIQQSTPVVKTSQIEEIVHLQSSNTAEPQKLILHQSPAQQQLEINPSLLDEEEPVKQQIQQNQQQLSKAAEIIKESKQTLQNSDLQVVVGSDDYGLSSSSAIQPQNDASRAKVKTLSSNSSDSDKPQQKIQGKAIVKISQKSKESSSSPLKETPNSPLSSSPAKELKKSPQKHPKVLKRKNSAKSVKKNSKSSSPTKSPDRPKSALHQVDDINDNSYIKNILIGNDSTVLDGDSKLSIKEEKPKHKKSKKSKKEVSSDNDFLDQLDAEENQKGKPTYKLDDDFDLDI